MSLGEIYDVYRTQREVGGGVLEFGSKELADIFLYFTYSPVYYFDAFLSGLFSSRQQENSDRYGGLITDRGQIFYGKLFSSEDRINEIVEYTSFTADRLIDHYFRKIIDLCQEHGIRLVVQSAPVTESTYVNMDERLIRQYDAYMEQIRSDYPNIVVDAEPFCYRDDLFADASHLNEEGASAFSNEMREKYAYIFEETET